MCVYIYIYIIKHPACQAQQLHADLEAARRRGGRASGEQPRTLENLRSPQLRQSIGLLRLVEKSNDTWNIISKQTTFEARTPRNLQTWNKPSDSWTARALALVNFESSEALLQPERPACLWVIKPLSLKSQASETPRPWNPDRFDLNNYDRLSKA